MSERNIDAGIIAGGKIRVYSVPYHQLREVLFGELPGCSASGNTDRTAAARLVRFDVGD